MNRYAWVFLIGFSLFLWKQNHERVERSRQAEYARALASAEDGCEGRKFCGVIYLAPWCPACRVHVPRFREFLAQARTRKDTGLRIVVGQGKSEAQNLEMAQAIGPGSVIDSDGSIARKLRVNRFPSFFVLAEDQKVVHEGAAAQQWVSESFRAQ